LNITAWICRRLCTYIPLNRRHASTKQHGATWQKMVSALHEQRCENYISDKIKLITCPNIGSPVCTELVHIGLRKLSKQMRKCPENKPDSVTCYTLSFIQWQNCKPIFHSGMKANIRLLIERANHCLKLWQHTAVGSISSSFLSPSFTVVTILAAHSCRNSCSHPVFKSQYCGSTYLYYFINPIEHTGDLLHLSS
jgi:hypothetical protein